MGTTIFPAGNFTRKDAINLILVSIAVEELALSHIINAESEKILFALKRFKCPEQILAVNNSAAKVLQAANEIQMLLKSKMNVALNAPEAPVPPGPGGEQADWEQEDETAPSYVKNRPKINEIILLGNRELPEIPISDSEIDEIFSRKD